MKCADVMTAAVEHCSLDEPVHAVARRMREANVTFVAVCDAAGALVGALTDRDLVVHRVGRVGEGRERRMTVVEAVMSNDLVCCAPDDDLDIARELMSRFQKSRVVCVDASLRPLGFITGTEMLRASLFPAMTRPLGSAAS
jgi:CBS domain-containing protein